MLKDLVDAHRSLLIARLLERLRLLVSCSGSLLVLVVLRPNVQLAFPFLHLSHMLLEESILNQVFHLVAGADCQSFVLQRLKFQYRF